MSDNDQDSPALRVTNLRFRYRGARDASADSWIVDLPSFHLAPAEQALLTGGSGSGKSTLLQLLAGLLDPDEGAVEIAGQPIHSLRGARRDLFRGRHIGMIFQTFNLLHGFSALENVMTALMFSSLPPRDHRRAAGAALEHLGIDRPNAPADELSVGQQQRVAVARAVVCDPTLVLADEPTASLDPDNAQGAMDLLQAACRERKAALLCVSHDPSLARRFDRRVALHELTRKPSPLRA